MTRPEPEWLLAGWIRLVQARWRATGVPRATRTRLLADLLSDLATARAAGATIEELVATHPAAFADACAASSGSGRQPIATASLLAVCLGTGVAAAGAAWLLLLGLSRSVEGTAFGLDEGQFFLFVDLALVAAVLAAMVGAVRWRFRRHVESVALAPRLAVTLVGGTLVGFPLASVLGATRGYRWSLDVVLAESLVVLVFLAAATVLAQRWTGRLRAGATRRVGALP